MLLNNIYNYNLFSIIHFLFVYEVLIVSYNHINCTMGDI